MTDSRHATDPGRASPLSGRMSNRPVVTTVAPPRAMRRGPSRSATVPASTLASREAAAMPAGSASSTAPVTVGPCCPTSCRKYGMTK